MFEVKTDIGGETVSEGNLKKHRIEFFAGNRVGCATGGDHR
jgi:hypothetical protein